VRTTQQINVTMSQMADQKASILMGATFVVFTISVGQATRGDFPYALMVLAVSAFLSALFAIAAVLPSFRPPRALASDKDNVLFFGVFAAMLYMTTRRIAYVVGALLLLAIGAYVAYKAFGHVRVRVTNWSDPWKDPLGKGMQPIQGWYALGSGGIGGTGLGLGHPGIIPDAATDFIFAAIGEELGFVGTMGVVAAFMLLIGSAFRIAIDAARPFAKLFAAGIATIIALQTFLILGGVLRVIPLTGITLPFVSYGGSSLVANFALLAILLRISDDNAIAQGTP